MKLIVGLGNPGKNHIFTRHNIGFMLIDALSDGSDFQNKHDSLIQKIQIGSQPVLLAKPQTYMNLSGKAVQAIMKFYKISKENLLVVQDDKDQNFLSIKFQKSRGSGGHNGIKDIHKMLGTEDYARLKLGIANSMIKKPESKDSDFAKLTDIQAPTHQYSSIHNYQNDYKIPTSDFVLSNFDKEEQKQLPNFLSEAGEAAICFIEKDFETARNRYNKKA